MKHVIAVLFLGLCSAAIAQTPASTGGDRASAHEERAGAPAVRQERCLGATATRIKRPNDPCAGRGRSYDRDDLSRTGETDTARALEKLDPSISRRR